MHTPEFWPSIHAAEGLTVSGQGQEVLAYLSPKYPVEKDDRKRCGLARELVRAGDRSFVPLMLRILAKNDSYAHSHAAESLYKIDEIGDGRILRNAFKKEKQSMAKLMIAAALGRWGNPKAMTHIRNQAKHKDDLISRTAGWILGRIGDRSDIPQLRKNMKRSNDPLTKAYAVHSLALLGDDEAKHLLLKNLASDDPAIRTYAATFAGDARLVKALPLLIKMLDDPNLDARIRAAQSVMVMSRPSGLLRNRDLSRDVFPASDRFPRNSEGSVLVLRDGSFLFATTEFLKGSSDFTHAHIVARTSRDEGKTWESKKILQKNTGKMNVMSVTLRRLRHRNPYSGPIGLFYLVKNNFNDLQVFLRVSTDEAKSFGEPIRVTSKPGYHVMNNDRVTVLSSGRLLVPVSFSSDVKLSNRFVSSCWISDDEGKSWREGIGKVAYAKRGAMEPEVLELTDGRIQMIFRTQLGHIAVSYSSDGGDSWSKAKSWNVIAPEAPATLRRIPSTGDLLLVWNRIYRKGSSHGGKRTPLHVALSSDEGKTWTRIREIETDRENTYSYPSLIFYRGRAILSYWVNPIGTRYYSTRLRSIPLSRFYSVSNGNLRDNR